MDALAHRVQALRQAFEEIARSRMAGLPLVNPRLAVACVGFRAEADEDLALGVLVTPWCMNLLRLPLRADAVALRPGEMGERDCGARRFDFVGAHEHGIGAFEAASLFSPMFEFVDQHAALATAEEALKELRGRFAVVLPEQPARRGFLFGRRAGAAP